MRWEYELESMESSVEKGNEERVESSVLDSAENDSNDNNTMKPYLDSTIDYPIDYIIEKIEKVLFYYEEGNILISMGENITDFITICNERFDMCLAFLLKYGVSSEKIQEYIDRRDKIVDNYDFKKKSILK